VGFAKGLGEGQGRVAAKRHLELLVSKGEVGVPQSNTFLGGYEKIKVGNSYLHYKNVPDNLRLKRGKFQGRGK